MQRYRVPKQSINSTGPARNNPSALFPDLKSERSAVRDVAAAVDFDDYLEIRSRKQSQRRAPGVTRDMHAAERPREAAS